MLINENGLYNLLLNQALKILKILKSGLILLGISIFRKCNEIYKNRLKIFETTEKEG